MGDDTVNQIPAGNQKTTVVCPVLRYCHVVIQQLRDVTMKKLMFAPSVFINVIVSL